MQNKKKTFCADTSKMSDTEKKIMATAMKAGEDQINILREAGTKNQEPKEIPEEESNEASN